MVVIRFRLETLHRASSTQIPVAIEFQDFETGCIALHQWFKYLTFESLSRFPYGDIIQSNETILLRFHSTSGSLVFNATASHRAKQLLRPFHDSEN